jgi:hypothetical protein
MRLRSYVEENGQRFAEYEYRCLTCQDTGLVTIFAPEVIQQAAQDPENVEWWRVCTVLCTCEATDWKATHFRSGREIPIFGSQRWHVAVNEPDARARAATLETW